jgi:hypothetical protein
MLERIAASEEPPKDAMTIQVMYATIFKVPLLATIAVSTTRLVINIIRDPMEGLSDITAATDPIHAIGWLIVI